MAEPLHTSSNGGAEGGANTGFASEKTLPSTKRLQRYDSLHMEAGKIPGGQSHLAKQVGWATTLHLAFQSIGVVYGDMGTSPLYVFSSTFTSGINDTNDILGVMSLIIYTVALLPLIKYCFIVLRANDNGDGGTFALYSLISRYARISLIPNQQAEDAMVSHYKLESPSNRVKRAHWIKQNMENSPKFKIMLFLVTILATSMVIGDGVLTPCISVLSAVGGIKQSAKSLNQGQIAGIAIAILIVLFLVQRFGTDKVGYTFAPIILTWFIFIAGIGVYNLFKHDTGVLKSFNPKYIVDYFKRNGKQGWISLGGVILCITGTEAMFADLGHFDVRAIQIGFSVVLLPSVLLAYIGQAAYLRIYPEHVADTFYKSIPGPLYWPTFVVAVAAAIIASQAMISGAFAIIAQSQILGCFPRVRVTHTSTKFHGQVYIPEINYLLMVLCVVVTAIFQTTDKIGNAYGIAVVFVMFITTLLVTLVMAMIWKTSLLWIALFPVIFGGVELIYLSSAFYKFTQGGYLPLVFAAILMFIMATWHYVHVHRYKYELKNKVSSNYVSELALRRNLARLPGIGFLYSELVQGIPPILPHLVEKVPSIHSVLVIISIKYLPISKIETKERFLFRYVEPKEYRVFRCVVRYGYNDKVEDPGEFESLVIENLKQFIHEESFYSQSSHSLEGEPIQELGDVVNPATEAQDSMLSRNNAYQHTADPRNGCMDVIQSIHNEMGNGVVHLLGETNVVAESNADLLKKIIVDYVYNFIRKNFRQPEKIICVPHNRLLRVGMTYEI
ncbi:potassium transporter 5 isoform X1 [Oryza brachyantha]|uniref:potassium transporter 5 isoform X1 n=1 Tax=Oryza brachyantha TaxID=4533 RepID=UPI001ADCC590|nr:potassium transporter 5 isoform X1 [Oryza brachyantha]